MNFEALYTNVKSKSALRSAQRVAARVLSYEPGVEKLSSDALAREFRQLAALTVSERAPKGFALVREAANRALGMKHFVVQLVGGAVLLDSKLAEMRTGEGKTLTVTLAAALYALEGLGVHVVTANSYLAQRDAELMRPVYSALGLTVSAVFPGQSVPDKQLAYACDITYGVGSEFGFDYLKDHLVRDTGLRVQRGLFAAVVDEVDSVLIDEARVPLIIAEEAADAAALVETLDAAVRGLSSDEHFLVQVKDRTAELTEAGYAALENALVASKALKQGIDLYDADHLPWVRHLHSAVKAYALYRKDRDYVVAGGELVLIDQGTGRSLQGRRFEDGLHEALEAKEGLRVRRGNVTKATITYQSFFALYPKLSGLTGTAATDAEEFGDIYRLETVLIPTNRPLIREQLEDLVFLSKADKFASAVAITQARHATGQPVLIGCSSIRDADVVSRLLTAVGVAHSTLTARHVGREAAIIAQAGRPGSVTVATNMAGRGTDILLGGEKPQPDDFADVLEFEAQTAAWAQARDAVVLSGGLFVLGTERSGLRRVDNQLAGRSGRQGDPGTVQFLLSLEDELLKAFGQGKQLALVRKLIQASGQALGGAVVAKLVESAQKSVEGAGFAARKSLMQFDGVLSDQRNAVYQLRDELLAQGSGDYVKGCVMHGVQSWVAEHMDENTLPELWDCGQLKKDLEARYGLSVPLLGWVNNDALTADEIGQKVIAAAEAKLEQNTLTPGQASMLAFDLIDELWTEHLAALSELRENVSLKTKTGFNPVSQYHKDAFELFKVFEASLNNSMAEAALKPSDLVARESVQSTKVAVALGIAKVESALERRWVGRNEPCPCGSGKRFKDCHGELKP